MASIREHTWSDGTTKTIQVRWRDESGKQTSESFEDRNVALSFKGLLESLGRHAAYEWLDRRATPEAVDVPALDVWMSRYIEHLTGITSGTRAKYLREVYPRYGTAPSSKDGPPLGSLPIDVIVRDHVAWATNDLAARFSPKSIKNSRGLLYAGYKAAIDDPRTPVTHNPFKGIRLPKAGEADDDHMTFLTPDEFALLYQEIPAYWRPLTLTLAGTGMRYGEATALQVRHVDLRDDAALGIHPSVRITRAWKHSHTDGWEIGPPKTKKSRRTVTLPGEVVDALRPIVEARDPEEFLFLNARAGSGGPVRHSTFYQKVWLPAVRRAGRCPAHRTAKEPCGCPGTLTRRPRIHDLRHTHVAWLIRANVPGGLVTIQQRLGHESIQTTVDVYGHLLPDLQVNAALAASAALAPLAIGQGDPIRLVAM